MPRLNSKMMRESTNRQGKYRRTSRRTKRGGKTLGVQDTRVRPVHGWAVMVIHRMPVQYVP